MTQVKNQWPDRPPYPADYMWRGCFEHNEVGYQSSCEACRKDALRGYSNGDLKYCTLAPRVAPVALIHYHLEAKIGCSDCTVYGLRCDQCQADFHLDRLPNNCPMCGAKFSGARSFGHKAVEPKETVETA